MNFTMSLPYHLKKITILDSKKIKFKKKNKLKFSEVSDLAYKNSELFAIGDKGILYKMAINLQNDKINSLDLLWAKKLHDNHGTLAKKNRDSEGLTFLHDNLLISFEKNHRIELYTSDAQRVQSIQLHKDLSKSKNYKSSNKGLESVAYSEDYGVLTAPEKPLKGKKYHVVYSKDNFWKFKADGEITAMEFMGKNKLLVLLREFNFWTRRRVTSLVQVNLKKCKKNICKSKLLVKLDSSDGWKIDNFEGLTKVGKNRFVMISDNQDSFFQKTLLVLFEIKH